MEIAISIQRVTENIYALSALIRETRGEQAPLLNRSHAAALRRTIVNLAARALLEMGPAVGMVTLPSSDADDLIGFSIPDHLTATGLRGAFEGWLADAVIAAAFGRELPAPPPLNRTFAATHIKRA